MRTFSYFCFAGLYLFLVSCGKDAHTRPDAAVDAAGDADADIDDVEPVPTGVRITAQEPFVIARDMGHLAFPAIARRQDGGWLLVYRQGSSHVDASGRIMRQEGSPDGRTWNPPETLVDTPGVDDRDPSISRLSDGRLVVTWFQYKPVRVGADTLVLHETFLVESVDDGHTWSEPVQVTPGVMDPPQGAHLDAQGHWVDGAGNPIVVHASSAPLVEAAPQGPWILPNYGGQALNLNAIASCTRSEISLIVGELADIWEERPVLPGALPNVWLQEPALLITPQGRWILHARTAWGTTPSTMGYLAQSVSVDGGETWSSWQALGFVGHAPDLERSPNGVLFSAFREIDDAFTQEWVSIMYSVNGGDSWSSPLRVVDCGAVECGYPSLEFMDSSHMFMVYYGPGGQTIEGIIFDLEWFF